MLRVAGSECGPTGDRIITTLQERRVGESLGRYCRAFEAGIVILSIARFFMAKSASTYMCVVAVLSFLSQGAITVMSTPD